MNRFRMVLKTEVFRVLLFVFASALSTWPFLSEKPAVSFRTVFFFFFAGWAVLVVLLFLMRIVLGRDANQY